MKKGKILRIIVEETQEPVLESKEALVEEEFWPEQVTMLTNEQTQRTIMN